MDQGNFDCYRQLCSVAGIAATACIAHYPAINLNLEAVVSGAPLEVNAYTGPVLICMVIP